MKVICIATLCLAAASLSGCIIVDGDHHDWHKGSWSKEQELNNKNISELQLNSSREEVVSLLGQPAFSEALIRDEDHYYVLYYRTHRVKSDGETTKNETTPLVFVNDQLIGWGRKALNENNIVTQEMRGADH